MEIRVKFPGVVSARSIKAFVLDLPKVVCPYTNYLFVVLLLSLSACIEPIELNLENEAGILIIEGTITNGPGPHTVNISRTVAGPRVPEPVGAASVFLIDDQGNTYPYFQELPGEHTLPFGAISAYPGVAYWLRIILPDGTTYESAPEVMPGLLADDTAYYDFTVTTTINENGVAITSNNIEAYIDSEIPESDQPLYYRWVMEEAYEVKPTDFPDPFGRTPAPCYFVLNPDPQRINLFSSLEVSSGRIEKRLMARRAIGTPLLHRYFILIKQWSLTQEAYTYWNNVRKNIEQTGSIFDIPPATVPGNIRNVENPEEVVYGYFGASSVVETRTELKGEDVPNFIPDPCEFTPGRRLNEYPRFCLRCSEVRGFTSKPSYF